jgi:hypothetical protein
MPNSLIKNRTKQDLGAYHKEELFLAELYVFISWF